MEKICTGLTRTKVKLKPRLLSDKGRYYLSKEIREYLKDNDMIYTCGHPDHPQAQGKIERYHQSIKNVMKLNHLYYSTGELERALESFVYQRARLQIH
ncbi:MAG: DDE-type integrase/transposase/recombinase [Candidatus Marinimicrobia bacterium]|nr:DDE-type integrase/transposase/recombinase [Candidatus Neomarinimicrobiota bacterium]MCH7763447.1 DDE-type integrase/transposase/recombinase [Candidatus Neomarinimicrobiota bacterium]